MKTPSFYNLMGQNWVVCEMGIKPRLLSWCFLYAHISIHRHTISMRKPYPSLNICGNLEQWTMQKLDIQIMWKVCTFIEMLLKPPVKIRKSWLKFFLSSFYVVLVISTYAAYDLFQVFQSGPARDNVCMKVFFRRKGEILKGLYKKLRFHMNFCSGIQKPRLDPLSFVKTRQYHTQMLLYGKPASHILVEQPIGPCWHIQGSQTHKGIQLCENNFREHPFYYEGFLLPSFLLFLTL